MTALIQRPRSEIAPGAVHVPGWLSLEEQRQLVTACRQWAASLAYHGVPKTLPGTGRPDIGLDSGRLYITLRESGLGAHA